MLFVDSVIDGAENTTVALDVISQPEQSVAVTLTTVELGSAAPTTGANSISESTTPPLCFTLFRTVGSYDQLNEMLLHPAALAVARTLYPDTVVLIPTLHGAVVVNVLVDLQPLASTITRDEVDNGIEASVGNMISVIREAVEEVPD